MTEYVGLNHIWMVRGVCLRLKEAQMECGIIKAMVHRIYDVNCGSSAYHHDQKSAIGISRRVIEYTQESGRQLLM